MTAHDPMTKPVTHWYGRAIKTAHSPLPNQWCSCEWTAWLDGLETVGPTGRGATEAEARRDLLDDLASGWVPSDV